MTTLDKIIHKYPDLVIFSFEILRKEHKKPGSANWLKKKKKLSLSYQWAQFDLNFLCLNYKAIIWTRDWTSPIPVKFAHITPEQKQTWISKMDS